MKFFSSSEKITEKFPISKKCAIATEAMRAAENGKDYINKIHEKFKINPTIISQKKEGELAFLSVISRTQSDPYNTIVWDIGGGSIQFTARLENDNIIMEGNQVASATFKEEVLSKIKSEGNSPNPMSAIEVEQAINLAKDLLSKSGIEFIVKNDRMNDIVHGIGAVHNSIAKHYSNYFSGNKENSYDINSIKNAILSLTDKTDNEIMQIMAGHADAEFAKSELTTLILIYAALDLYGIDKVFTLAGNNLEGLLIKGC